MITAARVIDSRSFFQVYMVDFGYSLQMRSSRS